MVSLTNNPGYYHYHYYYYFADVTRKHSSTMVSPNSEHGGETDMTEVSAPPAPIAAPPTCGDSSTQPRDGAYPPPPSAYPPQQGGPPPAGGYPPPGGYPQGAPPPGGYPYAAPAGQPGYGQQPIYGQPVGYGGQQPMMVTTITTHDSIGTKDQYQLACIGTAICGCFGVCAQMIMCKNLQGNLGAATGCIINSVWCIIAAVIWLILTFTVLKDEFVVENLSRSSCDDYDGNWQLNTNSCYMSSCPSHYDSSYNDKGQMTCTETISGSWVIFLRIALCAIVLVSAIFWRKNAKRSLDNQLRNQPQQQRMI